MNRRNILVFVILFLFVLLVYSGLTKLIFQQDEWMSLGAAITKNQNGGVARAIKESFNIRAHTSRVLPVAGIFNYYIFKWFGTSFYKYGVLAILLVSINSCLIFLFVYKLTKGGLISFFSSLLWLVNPFSYQAISWFGAMSTAQISFMFLLLGFIFWTRYLKETRKRRDLYASLFMFLVSLWSKETGIYYIVPVLVMMFFWEKRLFSKIALFLVGMVPFLVSYFVFRKSGSSLSTGTSSRFSYNIFLLPARSLSQVYFSQKFLYSTFRKVNTLFYGNQTDGHVIERIIPDIVSLLMSFYYLVVILVSGVASSIKKREIIFLALISFFSSIVPFAVFKSTDAVLEPRYYIYPALWSCILLTVVVWVFLSKLKVLGKILYFTFFSVLVYLSTCTVHSQLEIDLQVSNYRRGILSEVLEGEKYITDKNVFYFYTDHTGFYEFQSGFGQTLSVLFNSTGHVPSEILTDTDFWDPGYEGMKEFGNKMFGYYMYYDKLKVAVASDDRIDPDDVIAYYWDHQNHSVEDVTLEVRNKLSSDLDLE